MATRRTFLTGCLVSALVANSWPSLAIANSPASDKILSRIAFGSCAFQWEEQPIWSVIAKKKPDIFIFLGDAIYGDFDGEKPFTPTVDTLRRDWTALGSKPEFRAFRAQVPILATWDNHDYGSHNGGAEFPLKEMTKKAFLGQPSGNGSKVSYANRPKFGSSCQVPRSSRIRRAWMSGGTTHWNDSGCSTSFSQLEPPA